MKAKTKFKFIFPLLLLIALLLGIWTGLQRLGVDLPSFIVNLPLLHGPLMMAGFFGALIALERAVAVEERAERWVYLAPFLTAAGIFLLLIMGGGFQGILLICLGSFVLVVIYIFLLRLQFTFFNIVMGVGALLLLGANLLWLLGFPFYQVSFWWGGFLVLTIAGERLEMGRLLRLSKRAVYTFALILSIYLAGLVFSIFNFYWGVRVIGLGTHLFGIWLLKYDIARRTVRQKGLTRFIAICLITGYIWLGAGGVFAMVNGGVEAGPIYDTILHSVFLGFVFSMIFGHAPLILPSLAGLEVPFNKIFYLHLVLLHLSLIARVVGDLKGWYFLRTRAGEANAFALILFFIVTIIAVLSTRRKPQPT